MVGESLEQHCMNEFNKIRATAFRNAYFDKDNDASSGSKGDFIYRECDENGVEIISIMFEMKTSRTPPPPRKRTSISSKSLTRTDIRKIANTLYLFHFWKATASFITQASQMFHMLMIKCM